MKRQASFAESLPTWDTVDLRCWLSNHRACLAAVVNVGQVQRDRAEAVTLELIRRGEYDR